MIIISMRNVLVLAMLVALTASCATKVVPATKPTQQAKPAESPRSIEKETPAPALATNETLLCKLVPRPSKPFPTISPDGKRAAYVSWRDRTSFVVLDGVEGRAYDVIDEYLTFSPDSKHFAYAAVRDGKMFVVLDGVEHQGGPNFLFSPDSQHFAYVTYEGNLHTPPNEAGLKWAVVLDGVKGKLYDDIAEGFAFSPDSKRFAYQVKQGDLCFAVIDGAESKIQNRALWFRGQPRRVGWRDQYPHVGTFVFSPDSKHLAYAVARGVRTPSREILPDMALVLDEVIIGTADLNANVAFSPDSQHFAYAAYDNERGTYIMRDGVRSGAYYNILDLTFSPDSKRLTCIAQKDRGEYVIIDDVERGPYDSVGRVLFSPDSKRFAYIAKRNDKSFVVLDGTELPNGYDPTALTFSPDSKHFAYILSTGYTPGQLTKWFVVLDGVAGRKYDSLACDYIFRFYGHSGNSGLAFSPDSKHLAYVASKGPEQSVLVVDGAESSPYIGVVPYPQVAFTAPDKCRVFMYKNAKLNEQDIVALEASAPAEK